MMAYRIGGPLAALLVSTAAAQTPPAPAPAACQAALSAASDSELVRVDIIVVAYDTSAHLSDSYRRLIGEGVRQYFVAPAPLPLHVYDTRTSTVPGQENVEFAVFTLRSVYRAELHRDGHFSRVRTVGGTRDSAVDVAIIRAIEQLGASEAVPPPDLAEGADSVDLRFTVTPGTFSHLPDTLRAAGPGVTPLLKLRVAMRRVTSDVSQMPGNRAPSYPPDLRAAGVQGSTLFEFVVDATGHADVATVQILRPAAPQFLQAALDDLPNLRFQPLQVQGCPAPVLVQMPFNFTLTR